MDDIDHFTGLFGENRRLTYSFLDMMDLGDEEDNSINLLKYSPYYDEKSKQKHFHMQVKNLTFSA